MAQDKQTMQYGLWPSPIGPQSLAEGLRLSDVAWDSDGETLVWLEGRSDRGVLVCLPPGGCAARFDPGTLRSGTGRIRRRGF